METLIEAISIDDSYKIHNFFVKKVIYPVYIFVPEMDNISP
jgi:hypothetical protein